MSPGLALGVLIVLIGAQVAWLARAVRVRGRTSPDPGWVAEYASLYDRFRALYPALRGV